MLLKNSSVTEKSFRETIPLTIIGQTVRTRTNKFKNYSQETIICVTIQVTFHFTTVMYRSVNKTVQLLGYFKVKDKVG